MTSSVIAQTKTALILGITCRDGSYLEELLFVLHGINCWPSSFNTIRINHLYQDPNVDYSHLVLNHGDLTDSTNLIRASSGCSLMKFTASAPRVMWR